MIKKILNKLFYLLLMILLSTRMVMAMEQDTLIRPPNEAKAKINLEKTFSVDLHFSMAREELKKL